MLPSWPTCPCWYFPKEISTLSGSETVTALHTLEHPQGQSRYRTGKLVRKLTPRSATQWNSMNSKRWKLKSPERKENATVSVYNRKLIVQNSNLKKQFWLIHLNYFLVYVVIANNKKSNRASVERKDKHEFHLFHERRKL